MNRKEFLQSLIGASAFLAMPYSAFSIQDKNLPELIKEVEKPTNGSMFGFKTDPIKKVKVGFISLGNREQVLLEMYQWLVENNYAEIVALNDLVENKVRLAAEKISKWQKSKPKTYSGNPDEWRKMIRQDNIDYLIISTPWELDAPMAIAGMEAGKHAGVEVPIAYSEC